MAKKQKVGRPKKGGELAVVVSFSLRPDQLELLRQVAGTRTAQKGASVSTSSVLRELIERARSRFEKEIG
jgi:translation elongation factor EF-Ts